MRKIKRKLRIAAVWIALVLSGVGTVGILAAPEKDKASERELEKVLEENRKLIESRMEEESTSEQRKNFGEKGKWEEEIRQNTQGVLEEKESTGEKTVSEEKESTGEKHVSEGGESIHKREASQDEKTIAGKGVMEKDNFSKDAAIDWSQVTAVGDSVMLGAAGAMLEEMPGCIIDAKESRQAYAAPELLKELQAEGRLKSTVILALGTNGAFEEAEGQALLNYLGKDRTVYWVTVYGTNLSYAAEVNRVIGHLAEKNENLRLIPWDQEVSGHPEWLYGDGIHVNADGQKGYAKLVREVLTDRNVKRN